MTLARKANAYSVAEVKDSMSSIPNWMLDGHSIVREFNFNDFRQAIDFVNRVARAAEAEGHHPDILILYNRVRLTLSTHSAGGLTRKDFDLAAKVNRLL